VGFITLGLETIEPKQAYKLALLCQTNRLPHKYLNKSTYNTKRGLLVGRWYQLHFTVCTRLCGPAEWVTVIGNVSQLPNFGPSKSADPSDALCKRRKIVKPQSGANANEALRWIFEHFSSSP